MWIIKSGPSTWIHPDQNEHYQNLCPQNSWHQNVPTWVQPDYTQLEFAILNMYVWSEPFRIGVSKTQIRGMYIGLQNLDFKHLEIFWKFQQLNIGVPAVLKVFFTMIQTFSKKMPNIKLEVLHALFPMTSRLGILDKGVGIFDGPKWRFQDADHDNFSK